MKPLNNKAMHNCVQMLACENVYNTSTATEQQISGKIPIYYKITNPRRRRIFRNRRQSVASLISFPDSSRVEVVL